MFGGAPLDAAVAASRSSGAASGFHLATDVSTAEFFATLRQPGGILQYELSETAVTQLREAGASFGTIAPGPNGFPIFQGQQFVVHTEAFGLFNDLRLGGDITVLAF